LAGASGIAQRRKETEMGERVLIFAVCLVGAGNVTRAANPHQRWEDLVAKLTSLDRVTGSAVDVGGVPGKFFQLSKIMIRTGAEADFRKLLAHDEPVVRCMGLLALTQVNGPSSIATLKASVDDRGVIVYQPAGCSARRTTVGAFARKLLFNTRDLEDPVLPTPLLSERELIALDFGILAKDSTTGMHDEAARELIRTIEAGTIPLRRIVLKELLPHLREYEIIKAVGRLGPGLKRRLFLIECLHDKTLDLDSRLAAASALTRNTDSESFPAIEQELSSLNQTGRSQYGSDLVKTLNTRKRHEKNMEPIRAETTWRGMEKIRDEILIAFSVSHPLALDDLLRSLGLRIVWDHPDVRETLAKSFLAMSRNLQDCQQAWNTYSNTPYKLEALVRSDRQSERDHVFTDSERAEIDKNIRPFLAPPARQKQP
jgi:hypothetical protein